MLNIPVIIDLEQHGLTEIDARMDWLDAELGEHRPDATGAACVHEWCWTPEALTCIGCHEVIASRRA